MCLFFRPIPPLANQLDEEAYVKGKTVRHKSALRSSCADVKVRSDERRPVLSWSAAANQMLSAVGRQRDAILSAGPHSQSTIRHTNVRSNTHTI